MPVEQHASTHRCLNCDAMPVGPWCHECGQKSGPAHRSVLHLLHELAELMTHADSRIWRTLRDLVLHPASLTRNFLAGRRAQQIPPLRLFFVILLVLFAAGSLTGSGGGDIRIPAADQSHIKVAIDGLNSGLPRLDLWLKPHLQHAAERPDAVLAVMKDWLERFILLMLPVAATLLWLCTLTVRPRFSFFDHMVVALHSLSFVGLVQTAVFVLGLALPGADLLPLVLPVHLFLHLRGVYGGGAIVTLLRMAFIATGSLIALAALLLALAALGLQLGAR